MLTPVQVEPQRYRASYGRYLEDFVVGDIYEHRPGPPLPMPPGS